MAPLASESYGGWFAYAPNTGVTVDPGVDSIITSEEVVEVEG